MVKEKYYDPTFHGIDLEKNFKAAKEQIKKAERNGQVNGIIAQFLLDFNDSHLFFLPPGRALSVDYGFRMKMIGNDCFISAVKKGSDAEKQGVRIGDKVYSLETFEPTRDSLWKLMYFYTALSPQPKIRLALIDETNNIRQLMIEAKILNESQQDAEAKRKAREAEEKAKAKTKDERKRETYAYRCGEASADVMVCRLNSFSVPTDEIDKMMKVVGSHKGFVLDLRNNGGGYVATMKHLIGYFFDHPVKVGTEKMRKSSKDEVADPRGPDKFFKGDLAVLVDSGSGSASEVFARVIQLEKRGTVVGDQSAGAVMTSIRGVNAWTRYIAADKGAEGVGIEGGVSKAATLYGVSVTIADLIMSDGKSLEITGVKPDVLALPTGADLRSKQDVVIAKAAGLLGATIDPVAAGKLLVDEEPEKTGIGDPDGDD
jgi:carboxyl-terminal processing protease